MKARLTALLLAGVVLASVAACGTEEKPQQNTQTEAQTQTDAGTESGWIDESAALDPSQLSKGELFKEMNATDVDGNAIDSSVFAENKLTLVNIWNLGCTPCIQEIPVLDQLNKEYEGKGVGIMGLYHNFNKDISDDDKAAMNELFEKAGAEYTHIVPSADMYASDELENIQVFPTTYFVDSEGNIVDRVDGSNDYEGWKSTIEEMLKKVE